ncbi:MAG: alpha/beta fold hydrolase [Ramlibacter sp.]|nr:alpha/beta fold hydrolase [Ramlibacter sp.]
MAQWRPTVTDVHTRNCTIETMAAALLAEHAGDIVLCGASMGGMIAMEVAHQAPGRVKGLALLGTSAHPETDEMRALREAAIVQFEQGQLAEIIEPNVALAFHPLHASDQALTRAYLDFVYRAGAEQLVRQNRAVIARPDARLHLPALRCPVLVMCGDEDQLAAPAKSREIASLVPHSQLVMVPQCGHMLTMEQPLVVNETLAAWLESLALPERRQGLPARP